jgi:hypothetical protein
MSANYQASIRAQKRVSKPRSKPGIGVKQPDCRASYGPRIRSCAEAITSNAAPSLTIPSDREACSSETVLLAWELYEDRPSAPLTCGCACPRARGRRDVTRTCTGGECPGIRARLGRLACGPSQRACRHRVSTQLTRELCGRGPAGRGGMGNEPMGGCHPGVGKCHEVRPSDAGLHA